LTILRTKNRKMHQKKLFKTYILRTMSYSMLLILPIIFAFNRVFNTSEFFKSPIHFVYFFIIICITLLVLLREQIPNQLLIIAIPGLIFAELFLVNGSYPGVGDAKTIMDATSFEIRFKERSDSMSRILSLTTENNTGLSFHENWQNMSQSDYRSLKETIPMYAGLVKNYDLITFNEWSPLHFARYLELSKQLNEKILNRLGIEFIVTTTKNPIPGFPVIDQQSHLQLRTNKSFLDKFLLLKAIPDLTEGKTSFKGMHSSSYDPSKQVYVELSALLQQEQCPEGGVIRMKWNSTGSYGLDAELKTPSTLLFTEAFDSGWRAFVDGKPSLIHRADYLFQAVFLADGEHQIKIEYYPLDFKFGLFVTLITLLFGSAKILECCYKNYEFDSCQIETKSVITHRLLDIILILIVFSGILFENQLWFHNLLNWYDKFR
jgi:hypothetical protein